MSDDSIQNLEKVWYEQRVAMTKIALNDKEALEDSYKPLVDLMMKGAKADAEEKGKPFDEKGTEEFLTSLAKGMLAPVNQLAQITDAAYRWRDSFDENQLQQLTDYLNNLARNGVDAYYPHNWLKSAGDNTFTTDAGETLSTLEKMLYFGKTPESLVDERFIEEIPDFPENCRIENLPFDPRDKLVKFYLNLFLWAKYSTLSRKASSENKALLPAEQRNKWAQRTEPEFEALAEALSNGYRGIGEGGAIGLWQADLIRNRLHYKPLKHKNHTVLLQPNKGEEIDYLQVLIKVAGTNTALALQCILGTVLPLDVLPEGAIPGKRISLDDIAEVVLGENQRPSKEVRLERRARVWEWLLIYERLQILGERNGYIDFKAGKPRDTYIHENILTLASPEYEDLFGDTPPISVMIALTGNYSKFLTDPSLRLYIKGAEKILHIPGGKPSGALGRTLGTALYSFWRRHPELNLKPTRRELIEHLTMEGKPFLDYLYSSDKYEPGRAIKYWYQAVEWLRKTNIIDENSQELRLDERDITGGRPPKGWKEEWLSGQADFLPSTDIREYLEQIAKSKPKLKKQVKGRSKAMAKSQEYSEL